MCIYNICIHNINHGYTLVDQVGVPKTVDPGIVARGKKNGDWTGPIKMGRTTKIPMNLPWNHHEIPLNHSTNHLVWWLSHQVITWPAVKSQPRCGRGWSLCFSCLQVLQQRFATWPPPVPKKTFRKEKTKIWGTKNPVRSCNMIWLFERSIFFDVPCWVSGKPLTALLALSSWRFKCLTCSWHGKRNWRSWLHLLTTNGSMFGVRLSCGEVGVWLEN